MHFLSEYGLFLAKTVTWVIAILIILGCTLLMLAKGKEKEKGKLLIKKLNDQYKHTTDLIKQHIYTKKQLKQLKKEKKQSTKQQAKVEDKQIKPNLFVMNFRGDIQASAVHSLREEVTAILLAANEKDRVLLRLESPGGIVPGYGLAASQLQRLKDAKLKLIVAVDKVAASGGYMMACIAEEIIAAPFAVVGSIGVIAQLPNFHRYLEKKNIDIEQFTAGEYKRTVTLFGENTEKGRAKLRDEIEDTHTLFKTYVQNHRPFLNIDKIATGEHWYGVRALNLQLIDKIQTSDDYLLNAKDEFNIYEIQYKVKQPLSKRLSIGFNNLLHKFLNQSLN